MKINTEEVPNRMSDRVDLYHFDPSYYQLPPGEKHKLCEARARVFKEETNRRRRALEDKQKLLQVQQQQLRENVLQLRRQRLQEVTERFQRAHLTQRRLCRRTAPTVEEALVRIQSSLGSPGNSRLVSDSPLTEQLPEDVTSVSRRTKSHLNLVQQKNRHCDPDTCSGRGSIDERANRRTTCTSRPLGSPVPQQESPQTPQVQRVRQTLTAAKMEEAKLPEKRVRFIVGILKKNSGHEREETSALCDSDLFATRAVRDSVALTRARQREGGAPVKDPCWFATEEDKHPGRPDHRPSGTSVSWVSKCGPGVTTTPGSASHFTKKADVGVPLGSPRERAGELEVPSCNARASRIPQRAAATVSSKSNVMRPQSGAGVTGVTKWKMMDSSRNCPTEQKAASTVDVGSGSGGFFLHHTTANNMVDKLLDSHRLKVGPQSSLSQRERTPVPGHENNLNHINDKIPELWHFVHQGLVSSEVHF